MDVTIATCKSLPEPDHDEQLLLDALSNTGIDARMAAWEDESIDWGASPLTIVRSTWNYAHHREQFHAWMRRVASERTTLRNPLNIMLSNTHKGYLATLERAGIPVVPTRWFTRENGESVLRPDVLRKLPWDQVICKPAVGAGSIGVKQFDLSDSTQLEAASDHIALLQQAGDVLVQPYLTSIVSEGEHDIVWIDGEPTHVITKSLRMDGEDEQASSPRLPSEEERQLVQRTLNTLPTRSRRDILYARVDAARDNTGNLCVVEMELIEPSLFLWLWDDALERLVRALKRECGKAGS